MDDMDIIIVPTKGLEMLIFPKDLVSKVYPYAPPLSVGNASEFVIGGLLVQNERMPVLDFAFTSRPQDYEGKKYLVLVATVSEAAKFHRYAIVCCGEPENRNVTENQLKPSKKMPKSSLIAQYASLDDKDDENLVILDLSAFEAQLTMR